MSGLLLSVKHSIGSFLFYQSAAVKKWFPGCFMFILFLSFSGTLFAEGSKELNSNGGYRAFLVSSTVPNLSFPFPTLGTMKVYAKVGESIYLGSSAQGIGAGTINLRAPDGTIYTSGNSTTIGLISNRSQELAGPLPNAGGYTPFVRTVLAGQEGVWEIDFISQSNGAGTGSNPVPILANANWTQPPQTPGAFISYIAAFDVSVRDITNSSFIPGRLYTNIFLGFLGTFDVGFNAIFKILTKDGYQYTLDNNGQAGNGFSFFANNKGFRDATGAASYKSVDVLINSNIQDPSIADSPSDITHKIFFNTPASDLPVTANTPGGGTTWLLTVPVIPTVTNSTFIGIEGSPGKAGTNPLGGIIGFNANKNGTYLIAIDVNNNGIFTDAIDRKLTGTASGGTNQVYWDGLDGLGNKVPATGSNQLSANISIVLFGGEVHFPFFDVERNINGIILTRINGNGSPDNTIYWDDTPISVVGTPSNPLTNLTGLSSLINGHKWGTAGAGPTEFGDENGLDTWAYISSTPLISSVNFQLQEADLEVVSINSNQDCAGKQIAYTVAVKNNGPNNVSGAKFRFTFPGEITGVSVSSVQTTGISILSSETISVNNYDAILDMNNGAVRTFTISGNVSVAPAGGILNVTASIMRPADVTDPDATNPDAALPTDPIIECNSSPSGTGCNNVKILATSFFAAPNAGPDQTVKQNTAATMVANGTGIWTQSGSFPSAAIIITPTSALTTINGLIVIGKYAFIWTNPNGCRDTMAITVISSAPPETVIPNIFTPNGDGKNDVFEIKGIENFPGSKLIIFNRWGNEVYRSENYLNTWNGSGLADGTYFYILNRKENTGSITLIKGWVYLKR